jgi:uncharacterized Zn finger protein (UPF0148 family)
MGEQSDKIIWGEDCQSCGMPLLKTHGHPVNCTECGGTAKQFSDATDEERMAEGWTSRAV